MVQLARRASQALELREINRFRKYCANLSVLLPNATFVKVGANDGVTGDPCSDILLAGTTWRGVLIEPVPYCFERLKRNFGDSKRFALEQVAIGASRGKAVFYFVDEQAASALPDLPSYFDQLGSFDKSHILKHLDARIQPFIVESEVEVCTLSEVLDRNGVKDLHLLHIDAEGYDYEVLKTLDFANHAPTLLLVEHKHLSPEHRDQMQQLLKGHGYSIRDCGGDYFALNESRYRVLEGRAGIAGAPKFTAP